MKTTKRILALLLVLAAMTSALTACGGKSKALTKEEYEDAATKLFEDLGSVSLDSIDVNDTDAAKKTLEDMKKAFSDFANVTPPDEYADAHKQMKSGCEAMANYLDVAISVVGETDADKIADAATKAEEYMTTAVTDIMAGAMQIDGLS